jgi:hypothetical protein
MAGVSLADIAHLMGHKDLATTQIYAKVEQQHLRSVVNKLTPLVPAEVSLKSVTRRTNEQVDDGKLWKVDDLVAGWNWRRGRDSNLLGRVSISCFNELLAILDWERILRLSIWSLWVAAIFMGRF